jgi:putative copper export protein
MHALYLLSVWLHILAAITWFGGLLFIVLVVVPWLRHGGQSGAALFLRETGTRFRNVGWSCFAVVLVTGTFNLYVRGVRFPDFVRAEWLASSFGRAVLVKLLLFVGVLVVSAVHDFVIGPRAVDVLASEPGSAEAARLRRRAGQLGRLNGMLALALVATAVVIVRGWPF